MKVVLKNRIKYETKEFASYKEAALFLATQDRGRARFGRTEDGQMTLFARPLRGEEYIAFQHSSEERWLALIPNDDAAIEHLCKRVCAEGWGRWVIA